MTLHQIPRSLFSVFSVYPRPIHYREEQQGNFPKGGTAFMWLFSRRFWHSPRSDKKLNFKSSLVVCFFCSILFLLPMLWPVERLADIFRDAASAEWLTITSQGVTDWKRGPSNPADEAVDGLYREVNSQASGHSSALRDASLIRTNQLCPNSQSYMLADVKVCTEVAAISPPLIDGKQEVVQGADRVPFENFAFAIVKQFQDEARLHSAEYSPLHTEKTLARAILGETYGKRYEVPWVYLAREDGTVAVFPGNGLIDQTQTSDKPGYVAKSRPWYRAGFPEPGDQNPVIDMGRDSLMTSPYSDVLLQKAYFVRTYIRTFPIQGKKYLLAVDVKWPENPDLRGISFLGAAFSYLADRDWPSKFGISLASSLIAMLVFGWMTLQVDNIYLFARLNGAYGKVSLARVQNFKAKWREEVIRGVSIKADKIFGIHFERVRKGEIEDGDALEISKDQSSSWGLELWGLTRLRVVSWQFLWFRFEDVSRAESARALVQFSPEIIPHAEFLSFRAEEFQEQIAVQVEETCKRLIERNAVSAKGGRFEIREDELLTFPDRREEFIPKFAAPAFRNKDEIEAVHYGRAYVVLSEDSLDRLYSDAKVQAVILSSYLEKLLERRQTNFLLRGETIDRLVCFAEGEAELNLSPQGQAAYEELRKLYAQAGRARYLRRVDAVPADANAGGPQPFYDFAILSWSQPEESLVVVAQSAMEAQGIDPASSPVESSHYRIRGYISWRPADRAFFQKVWEDIAGTARKI